MKSSAYRLAPVVLAFGLVSGAAQAALHDRGGGLIYDDVLNLTWLQDANYAMTTGHDSDGLMTWAGAGSWADGLSYYDSVRNVTYTDWHLPTLLPVGAAFPVTVTSANDGSADAGFNITRTTSPLSYMFYVNLGNSGAKNPDGTPSGCSVFGSPACLANTGPFINLAKTYYWYASNDYAHLTSNWWVHMGAGEQNLSGGQGMAWAVRDGDVAAVPEAETWAMLLAGLGVVGMAVRRKARV